MLFNKIKNDYFWNTLANILACLEAVIVIAVASRYTTIETVGILSYAFSIGNFLMIFGKFGVRDYQISDVNQNHRIDGYLSARILTVVLMLICGIAYVCVASFHWTNVKTKIIILLEIILIYAVEDLEDVFWAYYQQINRMAVGAFIFSIRWITILIVFWVMTSQKICIEVSMFFSLLFSTITSTILVLLSYKHLTYRSVLKLSFSVKEAVAILKKTCFLLCVVLAANYIVNLPKYAIDLFLNDEIQGYFSYIFMPFYAIHVISNCMVQPQIVKWSLLWKEKKEKLLWNKIKKQECVIVFITIIACVFAVTFGIPILEVIFSTKLNEYKGLLVILMISGGLWAVIQLYYSVLAIMRKSSSVIFIIVSIVATIMMAIMIKNWSLTGAVLSFCISLLILLIALYCIIRESFLQNRDL